MKTKDWEIIALVITVASIAAFIAFPFIAGEMFLPRVTDENVRTVRMWARAVELGGFDPDEIVVTQGERVKLLIYTEDVVHGFNIAGYDMNVELHPGEWTEIEFIAENVGEFPFLCTIHCSPQHGLMRGKLTVMPSG